MSNAFIKQMEYFLQSFEASFELLDKKLKEKQSIIDNLQNAKRKVKYDKS